MSALLLPILLACSPSHATPPSSAPGAAVTSPTLFDAARPLLGLDRATLLSRLGGAPTDVKPATYGPSIGLEVVYRPAVSPARFYLANGKVILAYFSGAALVGVDAMALATAHPTAELLPSRAGKLFAHHVDAAAGLAWSDDGEEIAFVEVFAPTDLTAWTLQFYEAPGPFIK